MQTSFLDYYKIILDKVSFDASLFTKEYQKATRTLHAHEIGALDRWLKSRGLRPVGFKRFETGPRMAERDRI